jgi:hypothetical protein
MRLPTGHPLGIAPLVVWIPGYRPGPGLVLPELPVGIPLVDGHATKTYDLVLVDRPPAHVGDETLPDAALVEPDVERMGLAIPAVEVTYDGHCRRVRRPYGEVNTLPVEYGACVVAEVQVGIVAGALLEVTDHLVGE